MQEIGCFLLQIYCMCQVKSIPESSQGIHTAGALKAVAGKLTGVVLQKCQQVLYPEMSCRLSFSILSIVRK